MKRAAVESELDGGEVKLDLSERGRQVRGLAQSTAKLLRVSGGESNGGLVTVDFALFQPTCYSYSCPYLFQMTKKSSSSPPR